ILDVGCGPGSWCIDLAQKYPKIQVVGVDHLDIFPSEHNIPSNCQLLVADALNGLREFPESSFDVVHLRFMALAFTVSQYLKVIKDCWRLLKPGGYIEILESDIKVYSAGPVTAKANEEISKVTQSRNYCPEELIQLIPAMISLTGLNTQIKYRSIPM
ncbi:S-adenosyl-L-methionine-dependent methyltransferase, partial [Pilobolus umbonatus]